jgi:hypothetical protein
VRRLRTILTVISFILFLIVVADRISHFWRANQISVSFLRDRMNRLGSHSLYFITGKGEVYVGINISVNQFLFRGFILASAFGQRAIHPTV